MDSAEVKELAINFGADACGIASVERFDPAPKGFHPRDVYRKCMSVIVFAKRLPPEAIVAQSCVPYTRMMDVIAVELDQLALKLSLSLERRGVGAVPVPADDPYEYWDEEQFRGQGILSLRHAGFLAGLGVLGKNTLLLNARYGNTINLGAVLVDVELEPDAIADTVGCPPDCNVCIEQCPQRALDGIAVNQGLCRPLSTVKTKKGYTLLKCSLCRQVCPKRSGFKDNARA